MKGKRTRGAECGGLCRAGSTARAAACALGLVSTFAVVAPACADGLLDLSWRKFSFDSETVAGGHLSSQTFTLSYTTELGLPEAMPLPFRRAELAIRAKGFANVGPRDTDGNGTVPPRRQEHFVPIVELRIPLIRTPSPPGHDWSVNFNAAQEFDHHYDMDATILGVAFSHRYTSTVQLASVGQFGTRIGEGDRREWRFTPSLSWSMVGPRVWNYDTRTVDLSAHLEHTTVLHDGDGELGAFATPWDSWAKFAANIVLGGGLGSKWSWRDAVPERRETVAEPEFRKVTLTGSLSAALTWRNLAWSYTGAAPRWSLGITVSAENSRATPHLSSDGTDRNKTVFSAQPKLTFEQHF